VFEFLLAEWHITPDYIVAHWTDELLDLMTEKLVERKARESAPPGAKPLDSGKVSDTALFQKAKNLVRVVKRGD